MRKYTLNEDFFEKIDTEEKAYWLGFIAADGCIRKSGFNKKPMQLTITTKESDLYHVQRLADSLGRGKVCQSPGYDFGQLVVSCVKTVEDLQSHGISERKTHTIQPWDGPRNLLRHYWRGVIDGDGSIYCRQDRHRWGINLVGSLAMVNGFADFAASLTGKRPRVHEIGAVYQVGIVNKGTRKILETLYGDAMIALERKLSLALLSLSEPMALGGELVLGTN